MSEYLKQRLAQKNGKVKPQENKRYRIPKVSKKRAVVNRLYRKIVKEMALKDNECELKSPECTGLMQGADHTQKRSPKNLTDKKNLKRACNACNLYKETHPEWAEKNGHSKSRFSK